MAKVTVHPMTTQDAGAGRTAGPWTVSRNGTTILRPDRRSLANVWRKDERGCLTPESNSEGEANAAFIVRACNAHDALVDVCKEIVSVSDWNHDEAHDARLAFESVARKARAALALAVSP